MQNRPSAAEAALILGRLTARLKSRPDENRSCDTGSRYFVLENRMPLGTGGEKKTFRTGIERDGRWSVISKQEPLTTTGSL